MLQRLLDNKLQVKPKKCEFQATKVNFLCFVIAQGRLQPDPAKIQAVEEWPTSSTRKQLQVTTLHLVLLR